jgi:hypothetical protein
VLPPACVVTDADCDDCDCCSCSTLPRIRETRLPQIPLDVALIPDEDEASARFAPWASPEAAGAKDEDPDAVAGVRPSNKSRCLTASTIFLAWPVLESDSM